MVKRVYPRLLELMIAQPETFSDISTECGIRLFLEVLLFFLEISPAIYMMPGYTAAGGIPRKTFK